MQLHRQVTTRRNMAMLMVLVRYGEGAKKDEDRPKDGSSGPPLATIMCLAMRRALLIDDNPDIIELLAAFLRHAGWVPLVATSAMEAEAIAGIAKPNVILCDAVMPGLSGAELIERLKANPQTSGIPVILMSGYDESILATTAADGFLAKPFTINQVLTEIESVASQAMRETFANGRAPAQPALAN